VPSSARWRRRHARAFVARVVLTDAPVHRRAPSEVEVEVARSSAVGLEFVERFPRAEALLTEERRKAEQFATAMRDNSASLAEHGIEHLYIKFRKLYRYYDSNADVIVRPERWDETVQLLRDRGYVPFVMFKEPDKIMFDKPGEVSIHLHPGVTWNGVSYFDTGSLWERSVASPDHAWRELDPTHDLLTNLAHNVFENYVVSLGDVLFFQRFLRTHHLDVAEAERIATANGWGYGFRRAYAQIRTLLGTWAAADARGEFPTWLADHPYRIPLTDLAPTYAERIAHQLRAGRYRTAGREIYAYPAFYALMRRHDLPFL
jgi:hypothetical protein